MKKRPENVKNHETCGTMHVVINPRSQAASGLASVCAHLIGALTTLLIRAITDLQISELQ